MDAANAARTRVLPLWLLATALMLVPAGAALADEKAVDPNAKPQKTGQRLSNAIQPASAATGALRILLVDDDVSDNNSTPGDTRRSVSDTVFSKLVSGAVGGSATSWAVETVRTNANGPSIDKLRPYSLIVWYTGASYGGNPDNTSVLSIEDEKTVRRYLEETGGAVILISPGYASKVLEQGSSWEQTSWPFLKQVLGIHGGRGLVQRFQPGAVATTQGSRLTVGKGGAVESQFSAINPDRAAAVFTAELDAMGDKPVPVAIANSYGKGRFVYVGFTFENLDEKDLAPAFRELLAATGLQPKTDQAVAASPVPPPVVNSPEAEPATVQVSGTPVSAVVSWTLQTLTLQNAALGARLQSAQRGQPTPAPEQTPTVTVERLVPNAAAVRLNVASPEALNADDPGPLTPGRAVTYRVTLTDASGRTGIKEATFTPPPPKDPDSLSAAAQPDGRIVLVWPEVPGVTTYQVSGTALAAPVTVRNATEWQSPPQAPGAQQWKVASVYEPSGVLTAASTWPSVTSRVVPIAGRPFLSMPNGAGSIAESTALYDKQCETSRIAFNPSDHCPDAGWFLSLSEAWSQTYGSKYGGGAIAPSWPQVAFADLNDLALGRRVNCVVLSNSPRITMCWATSHGQLPAPGQSANGIALAAAGAQMTDIKSLNMIITSAQGSFFGTWENARPIVTRADTATEREDVFVDASGKRYLTALDNQGPKSVPNACLSCHGGRYDPTRKIIVGASLLPLVPAHLTFSSPQARASSEEQIRRVNQIVLESNPAPTISAQITALYNGTPGTPNTPANDAAVPSGWASQPGLYRQVIAPYCGSCHFSQTGPLNFATFANLQGNKQRIQQAVCVDFSMPHSEQGFRRFWTEGGTVFLPGLLSTVLGYPKCPQ